MNLGILSTLWKQLWQMNDSNAFLDGVVSNLPQSSSSPAPVSLEIETVTTNGFEAYSALNDQLLRCIMTGKGESAEADAIRDQMDEHWYKMSLTQQDAIRRHNETALKDT